MYNRHVPAFPGLGDEYTTFTHARPLPRDGVNLATHERTEDLPWAHWIKARAKGVGAYPGGAGQERGVWRPTASGCVMQSGEFFCQPCREALLLRIYSLVDPIDSTNFPGHPFDHAASLTIEDEFEFEVKVMQPKSHDLEVRWWLYPEASAPRPEEEPDPRYARAQPQKGDRRDRGPLIPLEAKPFQKSRANRSGVHRLKLKAKNLEPGRYRLICRAKDTTKMSGERLPWVLKDERGLLESERAWWIQIPER